jgi:DNA-binding MarR family transcriptional regulator
MSCVKIAQYLVLEAIKAGKAPEEIARLLDLEPHDVYAVIRLLEEKRLVERRPTFFGERYVLTEAGRRQLEEWRREVLGRADTATFTGTSDLNTSTGLSPGASERFSLSTVNVSTAPGLLEATRASAMATTKNP